MSKPIPLGEEGEAMPSRIIICIAAIVAALAAAGSALALSSGSWAYTLPVGNDLATFTGSCDSGANGLLVCGASQTSGPTVTSPFRNKSGNCVVVVSPGAPKRAATAHMTCSPSP
jgi:hypothetical protein